MRNVSRIPEEGLSAPLGAREEPPTSNQNSPLPDRSAYRLIKRGMDLVGAILILIVFSPFLLLAAIAIRTTMGSPVLFRQVRRGLRGECFELLKLRTMRPPRSNEEMLDSDADRITPVGRVIRRSGLDELPALWNVLRGEMSLVGPRPLLSHYWHRYSERQRKRHLVKPGITGLALIEGRNALSWEERFALDLAYLRNQSVWFDLKILAATLWIVLQGEGLTHQDHPTMPEFKGSHAGRDERDLR